MIKIIKNGIYLINNKTVIKESNEKELNIGAPVCAIGSPLDKSFSSTFTKGVLSAYRTTEGMTFIQSDVNVLPGQSGCPLVDQKGNAVGICVTGVF